MGIRDQSYQRYDGPLDTSRQWWTIGWHEFRTMLGFKRTKLTLALIWLLPLLFALVIIAESAFIDGTTLPPESAMVEGLNLFLLMQFGALALLFMARGCHLIADDQRYQTLSLYFSKPLRLVDYGLGKLTALMLLATLGVIAPSVLLLLFRSALYLSSGALDAVLLPQLGALGILVLICALSASVVLLISSLTRRSGLAVLIWLAVLIIPLILQIIVAIATSTHPWTQVMSLQGMIAHATELLYTSTADDPAAIPRATGLLGLLGLTAGALTLTYRRLLLLRHQS